MAVQQWRGSLHFEYFMVSFNHLTVCSEERAAALTTCLFLFRLLFWHGNSSNLTFSMQEQEETWLWTMYLFLYLFQLVHLNTTHVTQECSLFSISKMCLSSNSSFIILKPTNYCPRVVYWRKCDNFCHKHAAHNVKLCANLIRFYSTTEEMKL